MKSLCSFCTLYFHTGTELCPEPAHDRVVEGLLTEVSSSSDVCMYVCIVVVLVVVVVVVVCMYSIVHLLSVCVCYLQ